MAIFRELKRRKVLHTLSLYVVGCWVGLQVVEVLSEAGLPPSTMRYVLIAMSFGFPIILIIAWFYDVSVDGITRTRSAPTNEVRPELKLGDYALLAGLVAVIALNIYVLSSPPPSATPPDAPVEQRTLAVLAFDDIDLGANEDPIGDVIAGELRSELTRIPGLRVLGPETSRAIKVAGDRYDIAAEIGVTSILTGDAQLKEGTLTLQARLLQLPAGNIIWQTELQGASSRAVKLQKNIVQAALEAIIPNASADTTHAPRIRVGECSEVYDLYLRGKQLAKTYATRQRGMELLNESVRIDEDCAVAWAAIAVANVDWSMGGFAKAGAAARRALELNDSLAEAWAVLAEIAEQEKRWNEAEELFLRAIYVDPTSAHVNNYYGETLLARGRVREALHFGLEAYRYDPASPGVNWHVGLAARYLGDAETLIRHALIYRDLRQNHWYDGWDELAEGYLMLGEVDRALAIWSEQGDLIADWFPQCIRARNQPELREGLPDRLQSTLASYRDGELTRRQGYVQTWHLIRCATWIGDADFVVDFITSEEDLSTEQQFFPFFQADSGILRQTEFFRNMVTESGLLDYWRKWGWSDFCRRDGDSFQCD